MSDEEWELRRVVLNLHDATLKVRFFKSQDAEDQYKAWKTTMEEVRESLKEHPAFKAIDAARQQKLLSGQEMYVKGMRSTLKLAGFDDGYFDGMYAYISSQVHISPSSFYWTQKRVEFW